MIFLTKKILTFILLPPGLLIILLLILAAMTRRRPRAVSLMLISLAFFIYLPSTDVVKDLLLTPLEDMYFTDVSNVSADVVVMAGGGAFYGAPDLSGSGNLTGDAANRLLTSARLSRLKGVPVVLSGGRVFFDSGVEAEVASRILKDIGLNKEMIIEEPLARDTAENAMYVKKLCEEKGWKRVFLVTSAYHMPRTVYSFRLAGVDVIPVPADYRTNRLPYGWRSFMPDMSNIGDSYRAIREYAGIIWYRVYYEGVFAF